MDVPSKVLLQLFNKSKLRNGIKTFLEPKLFFAIYSSDAKLTKTLGVGQNLAA